MTLAIISLVALTFHCGAMNFSAIRSLPGLSMPADVIQDLGQISQIAYWLPAAALLMSLRRVWPPLLALEATALLAVGMTMFLPFGLSIHFGAILCRLWSPSFLSLDSSAHGRTIDELSDEA